VHSITFNVTYATSNAWVGLGFNPTAPKMFGADLYQMWTTPSNVIKVQNGHSGTTSPGYVRDWCAWHVPTRAARRHIAIADASANQIFVGSTVGSTINGVFNIQVCDVCVWCVCARA
jgi:hypothetical protein